MSQIKNIEKVLTKNPKGLTVEQISQKADVPKGNILSHIAVLRHKQNVPIVTERRTLKDGTKKVFMVLAQTFTKKRADAPNRSAHK